MIQNQPLPPPHPHGPPTAKYTLAHGHMSIPHLQRTVIHPDAHSVKIKLTSLGNQEIYREKNVRYAMHNIVASGGDC